MLLKFFKFLEIGLKAKKMNNGFPCVCCGFLTMSEAEHGTFEICPVCRWEDDDVQYNDIDYPGGANEESLRQARDNFKKFGASSLKLLKNARHLSLMKFLKFKA